MQRAEGFRGPSTEQRPPQGDEPPLSSLQQQELYGHRSSPEIRLTLDLSVPAASNRRIIGYYSAWFLILLISSAFTTVGFFQPLASVQLWLWSDTDGTVVLESSSGGSSSLASFSSSSAAAVVRQFPPWLVDYAAYAPCTAFQLHGCDSLENLRPVLSATVSSSLLPLLPLIYQKLFSTEMDDLLVNDTWSCGYDGEDAVVVQVARIGDGGVERNLSLTVDFSLNCSAGPLAPMVNLTTAVLWNVEEGNTSEWPAGMWPSLASSQSQEEEYVGAVNVTVELLYDRAVDVTVAYDTSLSSCAAFLAAACGRSSGGSSFGIEYLLIPSVKGEGVIRWCGGAQTEDQSRRVTVCEDTQYEIDHAQIDRGEGAPSVHLSILTEVWTAYREFIVSLQIVGGRRSRYEEDVPSVIMFISAEAFAATVVSMMVLASYILPTHRFRHRQVCTAVELDASIQAEKLVTSRWLLRQQQYDQSGWEGYLEGRGSNGDATPATGGVPVYAEDRGYDSALSADAADHVYGTASYLPPPPAVRDGVGSSDGDGAPPSDVTHTAHGSSSFAQEQQQHRRALSRTSVGPSQNSLMPSVSPVSGAAVGHETTFSSNRRADGAAEVDGGGNDWYTVPFDDAPSMSLASAAGDSDVSDAAEENSGEEANPGDRQPQQAPTVTAAPLIGHAEAAQRGPVILQSHAPALLPSSVVVPRDAGGEEERWRDTTLSDEPVWDTERTARRRQRDGCERPTVTTADAPIRSTTSAGRRGEAEAVDNGNDPLREGHHSREERRVNAVNANTSDEEDDTGGGGVRHSTIGTGTVTVVLTTVTEPPKRKKGRKRERARRFRESPSSLEQIALDARAIVVDLRNRQVRSVKTLLLFMLLFSMGSLILMLLSFIFVFGGVMNHVRLLDYVWVSSVEEGRKTPVVDGWRVGGYRGHYTYEATMVFIVLEVFGIFFLTSAFVVLSLIRCCHVF